jgi:hypothetical protein
MKYITIAVLMGTAVLSAGAASAQQGVDFSKVEIKTTDLGSKTYMLEGQGGDITVAVGTDGIKLVSLATRWDELNTHVQASGQLLLPL